MSVMLLLLVLGSSLGAQARAVVSADQCLDALPASVFTRVPVYLEAKAIDSASRAILPGADSLVTRVAALIRLSLSDSITSLPDGEGILRWRQLGAPVRVAVHHDGRFTWSVPPRRSNADTVRTPSRLVLEQALATLRDAGGRVSWPAIAAGDSLTFDLAYRWADVAPDGTIQPLLVRQAVPVFSMAMPWSQPVVIRYQRPIAYPFRELSAAVAGTVVVRFVVDTTGRASMGTFEDTWSEGRPRLTGDRAEHYRNFLDAVRWSLSSARFDPARLGGCVVPQLVQQPFNFDIRP